MIHRGTPQRMIDGRYYLACPQHGPVPVRVNSFQDCPCCLHPQRRPRPPLIEQATLPLADPGRYTSLIEPAGGR